MQSTSVQGSGPASNRKLKSERPHGFHESSLGLGSLRTKAKREQLEKNINIDALNLSVEDRAIFTANSHIRQVFLNKRELVQANGFSEKDRVINMTTAPRAAYESRTKEAKTTVHSGQRKLLDMEIEFLTRYANQDDVVIYAGAAPGHHHQILEMLFPFLFFVLYDPRKFPIQATPKRELNEIMFTHVTAQELAVRFKGKRCFFISDVRRHDEDSSNVENERIIQEDMQIQMVWVQVLNPVASLLKFRPPYPLANDLASIQYFKGSILIQPWTGATSTETRLLVTNKYKQTIYDCKLYEDIMFHFNTVTRTTYYQCEEKDGCHCYDCSTEKFILDRYFMRYPEVDREIIEREIAARFSM